MKPSKRKRPRNVATSTTGSALRGITLALVVVLGGCGASLYTVRLAILQAVDTSNGSGVILKTDPTSLGLALSYLLAGVGAGLLTLLAVFFVGGTAWERFLKARKLDRNGVITQGTITDLQKKRGLEERVFYCVTYRYGGKHEATTVVKRSKFQQLSVGDTVAVRLLPNSPSTSRPEWNWAHRQEV